MESHSRIKACISMDAIAANLEAMHKNMRETAKMIAVIKADGYGHGAVPIARMVESYSYIWGYAVATVEEGIKLRDAGLTKPVLLLGYTFEDQYEDVIRNHLTPTLFDLTSARKLSDLSSRLDTEIAVHLAVDTGMSRIGFPDDESGVLMAASIAALPNLRIEGLFTHFARADEVSLAPARSQFQRFLTFIHALSDQGISIPLCHCSNSAGILRMQEANLDLVRAGIAIYGIYPSKDVEREPVVLKQVMSLKSHITYLKEVEAGIGISYGATYVTDRRTTVATIPAGYADGYPRSLSNKGYVLLHGQKAPIRGRVCMDQFMVDVTHIPNVHVLDEVTLLGEDEGAFLSVQDLSDLSGRFSYELVCDIGKRVPRVYQ